MELNSAIHESGSVRMGPNNGANAVDVRGAVYGTSRLYVADNSIIPLVPEGNTQSTAYFVGQQVGKMLVGEL